MSDPENRLIGFIERVSAGGAVTKTVDYAYDAAGRRIRKDVDAVITAYVYDGSDILFEYDSASVLQARYTHGLGIDEPLIMARAGQSYCYHADGLGSVTELTDSAGTVVQAHLYDSYGNIIQVICALENPYTYTGRELDPESGLYYLRTRYYNGEVGRFITEDSMGLQGGLNRYSYVGGNPLNWVDPLGLFEITGFQNRGEGKGWQTQFKFQFNPGSSIPGAIATRVVKKAKRFNQFFDLLGPEPVGPKHPWEDFLACAKLDKNLQEEFNKKFGDKPPYNDGLSWEEAMDFLTNIQDKYPEMKDLYQSPNDMLQQAEKNSREHWQYKLRGPDGPFNK